MLDPTTDPFTVNPLHRIDCRPDIFEGRYSLRHKARKGGHIIYEHSRTNLPRDYQIRLPIRDATPCLAEIFAKFDGKAGLTIEEARNPAGFES